MDMPEIVVCSLLVNRPVRTRMPGGVGGYPPRLSDWARSSSNYLSARGSTPGPQLLSGRVSNKSELRVSFILQFGHFRLE